MSDKDALWKILGVVVAVLTIAVPAYVAYDIYGRGPIPEKRLELFQLTAINPLRDLSAFGERASFSLRLEKQRIDNLTIVGAWITNKGGVPILPSDFYEKLSVTVEKPWKIVAVENRGIFSPEIRVSWRRVSETRFEAEPLLLNPGDRIEANVYLTDTEFQGGASAATGGREPVLKWRVRIANLRGFSDPPDLLADGFGIQVRLSGWALPFTLFAAMLFQALYIHLLFRAGFLQDWTWRSIIVVLCASLLAFSAAEASATYLFPDHLTKLLGVDHWLNAPVIVAHALALSLLYWRARALVPQDTSSKLSP